MPRRATGELLMEIKCLREEGFFGRVKRKMGLK